jgi:hypothetical protein
MQRSFRNHLVMLGLWGALSSCSPEVRNFDQGAAGGSGTAGGSGGSGGQGGAAGAGGQAGCSSDADCGPSSACTRVACSAGTCVSMNAAAGTTCGPQMCGEGHLLSRSVCDGNGACTVSVDQDCAPYTCDAMGCRTRCMSRADCAPGFNCDMGACRDCETCGEWLSSPRSDTIGMCEHSQRLFSELYLCACSGPCYDRCSTMLCDTFTVPSPECRSCIDSCAGYVNCRGD